VALLESRVVLFAGMFLEAEKVWHHKLEHAWSWNTSKFASCRRSSEASCLMGVCLITYYSAVKSFLHLIFVTTFSNFDIHSK